MPEPCVAWSRSSPSGSHACSARVIVSPCASGRGAARSRPRPWRGWCGHGVRAEHARVVLPAADPEFSAHLARRAGAGIDCNVNLLGEAILGDDEARRAARRCLRCAATRRDVRCVSVKVELVVRQPRCACVRALGRADCRAAPSGLAGCRGEPSAQARLPGHGGIPRPATSRSRRSAVSSTNPSSVLSTAGVALQAYLPDSIAALDDAVCMGRGSSPSGGALVRVRIVKGANLAMEQVDAELSGWTAGAVHDEGRGRRQLQADARSCVRRRRAWRPVGRCRKPQSVRRRVGVDPARRRVVSHDVVEIEMLEGMAPAQSRAVRAAAGGLLLYCPVVDDADHASAIAYLSRRLDENAARGELPARAVHDHGGISEWEVERAKFGVAVAARRSVSTVPRRDAGPSDRSTPIRPGGRVRQRARHRLRPARKPGMDQPPLRRAIQLPRFPRRARTD